VAIADAFLLEQLLFYHCSRPSLIYDILAPSNAIDTMGTVPPVLPTLTVNRSFMQAFIAADRPCCALGMVEIEQRQCAFLALRPDVAIPSYATDSGFNFGHTLYGDSTFEVIHFSFEFYGFQTYNVLINPNNPIVRSVLQSMIESGDFFFFAVDERSGSVTAFRTDIGRNTLTNLTENWERIQNSTTTELQYHWIRTKFAKKPDPNGLLMHWVCGDHIDYLDLTKDRLEMKPE
jgi:hypothetical protein